MAALVMNGRYDKLAPSRFLKSSLALARMREIAVRSTSTVAVSWAATCRDSTIRLAMVWRSLDIFSVVPRRVLAPAAADVTAGVGLAAGAPGAGGAAGALAASAAALLAASAAARTSCLRIR